MADAETGAKQPGFIERAYIRLFKDPERDKHNYETFGKTHLDVFRERFGEEHPGYPNLIRMADSLDREHNTPNWSWRNAIHKWLLRNEFDKLGIERKH